VWWVVVIGAGAVLWLLSKKLPTSETLDIAREHQGELRVTDLTSELNVTLGTARKILTRLEEQGYARAEVRTDSGGENYQVWVFPEIRDQISF
jgi:predicted ArsR family transcriptional regulator